ncbi:ATP-binding protein [Streptomyces nigrescens]|uniref:ATP-binding protein n=2 Tax=Streptomyces nigrescens TaxID=1920 RepID=A0A640TJA4_STRNI|nr:ATP-binding protein [Streptomyces libani subsp. libani]GGV93639.1 ATP-binding protein [Streptomyces libani subsp. libani]
MNGMKITSVPHPLPAVVWGESPDSIHRAREATRAFTDNLTPAPDPERADTLLLVVSELATNALRHGGGRYTLQLFAGPDTLTAAVSDLSSAAPRDRTPDLNGGSGGFGWHMIRHLTSHLTITPAPGAGKTIRAQLPR